ncbi:hypothetical protein CSUI_000605 [Cystoisospora suis]|uniref:Transmembrane protein n=1 Tax=Cystoisospora suis TaxID=483139 RepID=A0A2C6LDA5_9APIC|nr:hypothetical protein CSUI_000605 [Cystoisospora suis]
MRTWAHRRFWRRAAYLSLFTGIFLGAISPCLAASTGTTQDEGSRIFAFLPVDQLLPTLQDSTLLPTFLDALPSQWALPKFTPSSAAELGQLRSWLEKTGDRMVKFSVGQPALNITAVSLGRPSLLAGLLEEVLSTGGTEREKTLSSFLGTDGLGNLPPILREFAAALPLPSQSGETGTSGAASAAPHSAESLLDLLPDLDLLNTARLAEIFAVPTELAWPVGRQRLELLLPVITRRDVGGERLASMGTAESLTALRAAPDDLLIPLAEPSGKIVFANLADAFPDLKFPPELNVLPLATLRNKDLGSMDSLWRAVKGTVLSRMAILGGDNSPYLVGPVLSLTSLSRLQLASSLPLVQRITTNVTNSLAVPGLENNDAFSVVSEALSSGIKIDDGIKDLFANQAFRLQEALLAPLQEAFPRGDNMLSRVQARAHSLAKLSPRDFLENQFFELKLPVVGLPRESLLSVFAPLQHLRDLCGGATTGEESSASCPLSLSPLRSDDVPTLTFGNPVAEEGLEAMYMRAEYLSEQLRSSLEQLQDRVSRTWAREANSLDSANRAESNAGEKPAASDAAALQQALDATVKLANTMAAALRSSKKEVKALHLLDATEDESRTASVDSGPSALPLVKPAAAGSTSQLRAFIANIEGGPLLAVPRSMYGQLLRGTDHLKSTTTPKENHVRRRRLQAATTPPLTMPGRTDGLVLVDPLLLSSLLGNLRGSDGPGILGLLRETMTQGPFAGPAADAGTAEARSFFPPLTPLLEDLFSANLLSLPTLVTPAADLLRTGTFPTPLLQIPLSQWVSSTLLPAELSSRTLPELLAIESVASQMRALPLADLLPGARAAMASLGLELPAVLDDESTLLSRTVGDLQLNALMPPQLLQLPLSQLVDGGGVVSREILDLPLGSVLAGGDAAASLLTQPFVDVLGLRGILDNVMSQTLASPVAEEQGHGPAGALNQRAAQAISSVGALPGGAIALPVASGEWLSLRSLGDLSHLSIPYVTGSGAVGNAVGTGAAAGNFLGGRGAPSPQVAKGARLLKNVLPVGEALKNLPGLAVLPLGNELFF